MCTLQLYKDAAFNNTDVFQSHYNTHLPAISTGGGDFWHRGVITSIWYTDGVSYRKTWLNLIV